MVASKAVNLTNALPATFGRRPGRRTKAYKLCVCLEARQRTARPGAAAAASGGERAGLVFAVRPQLRCSRFSAQMCSASSAAAAAAAELNKFK